MAPFPADVCPSELEVVSELIADVDRRLRLTRATLIVASGRFRRCPSAAQGRAYQEVVAQVDELLDLRLALTCPPGSPVGASH
jgi:hypothetical protein